MFVAEPRNSTRLNADITGHSGRVNRDKLPCNSGNEPGSASQDIGVILYRAFRS
jgi:hypothetical protein